MNPPPDNDHTIRTWAARHGHPIPPGQPIPDTIREQHRKARAYMIRRTYATRNSKTATANRDSKNRNPDQHP